MRLFTFQRATTVDEAVQAQGAYLAGGTSLVDLMKIEVLNPAKVVDVTRLPLGKIEALPDGRPLARRIAYGVPDLCASS